MIKTTWTNLHPEARDQLAQALRRGIAKAKGKRMDTEEKRGIVRAITGRGGMLSVTFEDPETHKLVVVHADNGPTVRALQAMFGNVIKPGHRFDPQAILGQEIGYDTDDLGILAYITE